MIMIQVHLRELDFVLKTAGDSLGAFHRDPVVLQVQRKEGVIVFEYLAKRDGSLVFYVVVFEANLLEGVHHLHAICDNDSTLLAYLVRIAVELAEAVVGL